MSCADTRHQDMHEQISASYRSHLWSDSTTRGSIPATRSDTRHPDGPGSCRETSLKSKPVELQSTLVELNHTNDSVGLRDNQRRALSRKQAVCHLCHKAIFKRVLRRHLRTVHYKPPGSHKLHCPQCDRSFARRDIFDRHQAEQHGDGSPLVECISCGLLVRQRALDEHYRTRKCQWTQYRTDTSQFAALKKLSVRSTIDPFLAAAVSSIKQSDLLGLSAHGALLLGADHVGRSSQILADLKSAVRMSVYAPTEPCNSGLVELLHIRGIALRAASRALEAPTKSETPGLSLALAMVSSDVEMGIGGRGTSENQNRVLHGAINALIHRFNCDFTHRSLWIQGGFVAKLERHLKARVVVSEATPAFVVAEYHSPGTFPLSER